MHNYFCFCSFICKIMIFCLVIACLYSIFLLCEWQMSTLVSLYIYFCCYYSYCYVILQCNNLHEKITQF